VIGEIENSMQSGLFFPKSLQSPPGFQPRNPNDVSSKYLIMGNLDLCEGTDQSGTKGRSSQETLKKFSFFEGYDVANVNEIRNYDF
jgi:hypothetical protein